MISVVQCILLVLSKLFSDILSLLFRLVAVWGTLFYLAPEMTSVAFSHDVKCDVWSLGVTTYEMLCRKVPFKKPTEQETLLSIQNDDVNYTLIESTSAVRFLRRVCLIKSFSKVVIKVNAELLDSYFPDFLLVWVL